MSTVPSSAVMPRRSRFRWFWAILTLVTCGALLWGCAAVFVIPTLDTDLTVEEAQGKMDKVHIRIPDTFELVGMRRFGCPGWAPGTCGYVGSYVGPADQLPDHQTIFTDPTYHQPLRTVTCAELKKQIGFEPATKSGENDWKFDCANAIELFASTPYADSRHDYPELTLARDSQVATIYFYQRPT
ncbi:hypothetical protein [Nocardia brasiliensis]|uniref:hypothetical protein n=1 Tax=Nocardia brasiliensis TaxID=37326 RepID=UPI001894B0F4|nr:hypothetical protein [Nocardia brasiliensis]MBF6542548.1 hypothetical protein [Nocardia brasiliensis]